MKARKKIPQIIREGVKKKTEFIWDFVLKHVIHKWGGHIWPFHDALRPQRFWNFGILSEKFLIFSKK